MTTTNPWDIEIDLNVRTTGNNTWTYLDDTDPLRQQLNEGDAVVVGESETRLSFPASVVEIDRKSGYVRLDVTWEKWKDNGDDSDM